MRKQRRHLNAAFASACGLEGRGGRLETALVARHESDALLAKDRFRHLLAVEFLELRLGVEQIDMRRPAGHEEIDDVLDLGREVRRGRGLLAKKRCQRRNAQPCRGSLEEAAASEAVPNGAEVRIKHGCHSRFFSSSRRKAFSARLTGAKRSGVPL